MNTGIGSISIKKRLTRIAVGCLALFTAFTAFPFAGIAAYSKEDGILSETVLYVSPNEAIGYKGDGTWELPFATVGEANDRISSMSADEIAGGVTVYLREGVYTQTDTLLLGTSGTSERPVVYSSYEGEDAEILGGAVLSPDGFRSPSTDEVACIKNETAKSSVLIYDLRAAGIKTGSAYELFYDGKKGTVARYPNAWNPDDPPLMLSGTAPLGNEGVAPFTCDADPVISTWHSIEGVQLEGHFYIDWIQTSGSLTSYEPESGKITVSVPSGNNGYREGGRYYFRNVLDELDLPGEYYISSDGLLYFYPEGDIRESRVTISQCTGTLVQISADNVVLDGITVGNTAGNAMVVNGSGVTVRNCNIGCCRLNGLTLNGFNNYVSGCDIGHIGYSALTLNGGDLRYSIPSNSVADNNYIHDFGEVKTVYEVGLGANGIGFTFTHNEIAYCPHAACGVFARDIEFRYNYFHDVCREGGDAGAVYIAWWSNQNLVFENNAVCDVYNIYNYSTPNGFYCDDGGSGKIVRSNLFYNVSGHSVAMGGGKDNIIEDNVVVKGPNCYNKSIAYDARTWYRDWCAYFVMMINEIPPTRDILWDDIFGDPGYGTTAWSIRYPRTLFYKASTVRDEDDRYLTYATANVVIRNNVIYPALNTMEIAKPTAKFAVIRNNMYYGFLDDIAFADIENRDFTITEDSLIFRDIPGFKSYDFDEIGLIRDN